MGPSDERRTAFAEGTFRVLNDVRAIEVAMLAPSALGMHLADLGAEVIKVEDPALGDYVRTVRHSPGEESSPLHRRWNRGKRSVALDLRNPEGRTVFEELVRHADVVIEGLRPGALDRRGVGYERVKQLNPRAVFVSISGFGQFGPYRDIASHGPAFEAYAGLAEPVTGRDGRPRVPAGRGGVGIQVAPLVGALATLAGLLRARSTGHGSRIDVAESDGAAYWNALTIEAAAEDRERARRGVPPVAPPFGLPDAGTDIFEEGTRCQYYETADHRYVIFMALEAKFFENFASAIGREDLLTLSRATHDFDHEYGNEELRQALTEIFCTRPQRDWLEIFAEADVPGIPVNVDGQVLDDPHFVARTRWLDPAVHGRAMMALPVHGDPPLPLPSAAPGLGEHTAEVLHDVLGYTDDVISALRGAGAFGTERAQGRQ
jgi:crotonobetainyl-CoA:carnitine CoA-transferase CaiB-like acyl-CoA transferase